MDTEGFMTFLTQINQLTTYIKSKQPTKDINPISKDLENALQAESNANWEDASYFYKKCMAYDNNNALFSLKLATILNRQNSTKDAKNLAAYTITHCLQPSYDALSAINIHAPFFLERHLIAEFIYKNSKEIKQKISENIYNTQLHQNIRTKVFVFWDTIDTMPQVVKAARNTLKHYIGDTYELIELDSKNLHNYLDIPEHIHNKLKDLPAHFSDWLRTKLLQKYGGIWLDSTCLLSQDLKSSLSEIEKQESFFYCYSGSRVGSWFFYSKPNSYILNAIDAVLNLWWEKESYLTNYFMYHDIVEMLYWTDPEYKKCWDNMVKTHPRAALELNNNLANSFDEKKYHSILKNSYIHKLTYKISPKVYQFESFMTYIIKANVPEETDIKNLLLSLPNKLAHCTKVWNYQHKVDVLEFEYDSKKFAYDIYKENDIYKIDLVQRSDNFKKLYPEITDIKLKNFLSSKNLNQKQIIDAHNKVLNKIDSEYSVNVSIIVTTFNRKKIITKLLDSLKNQKNQNVSYEVIIIDDHSTDDTNILIENYIQKYKLSNFRYYLKPYNSGNPSIPRNDGIFLAKGKYVFFVDSDDYIHQDTIFDAYQLANKNNSDITFVRIGSSSGNRKGFGENLYTNGTIDKANFTRQSLYQCPQIFCFFNRNFLINNRVIFNPSHKKWEDLIFMSKALNSTNHYSILGSKVYYFLEDFQEDNLTLKDLDIYQQTSILIECHNFYLFNRNIEKYSNFLNRLINFLVQKLKSKLLNNDEKFFVFNTISSNINFELIDFKYLTSQQNQEILKALITKNFNKINK